MKNWKKLVSVLLSVLMLVSLLAACSGGTEETPDATDTATETAEPTATPEQEITLTWVGAGWSANGKSDKIIAKWEAANPNIKINYVELGTTVDAEYLKNLDVMIAGGETVDVTYLNINDVYSRVMNGGALPIDEYITAAGDDFEAMYGSLATTMLSYQGGVYGVPYANNTFKVFYNKTLFESEGITIPDNWTIEDFTAIAQQLTTDDRYGCIFPVTWDAAITSIAEVAGWQSVAYDASGSVISQFDNETFTSVLQWVKDLADTYEVAPSYATYTSESMNRRMALASGQTAMIIDGPYTLTWLQGYMFEDPGEGPLDIELGVAELPIASAEAANVSYDTLVGAFYIPKSAAYPAEAYAFAKFICNECLQESGCYMPAYTGADMASAVGTFLTYTDTNGTVHENVYDEDFAISVVSVPNESHVAYWDFDPALASYSSAMATLFAEQYTLFLTGEMSLDDWIVYIQGLAADEISNMG